MSMNVALLAARNTLRTAIASLASAGASLYCDIQMGGRPPANGTKWYVALDEGGVAADLRSGLQERYSMDVTISYRLGQFAPDRLRAAWEMTTTGMDAIERLVITTLHGSHTVRAAGNTLLGGSVQEFSTPFYYVGRGKTTPQDGTWAIGETSSEGATPWMVRVLNFTGMLRTQNYGSTS